MIVERPHIMAAVGAVFLLAATDMRSLAQEPALDSSALAARYRDHRDLSVYLGPDGQPRPIRSAGDWKRRRAHILAGMQRAMGALPRHATTPLKALEPVEDAASVTPGPGFTRRNVSFASGEGDRIPAHLYLPDGIAAGERRPAMLALHPTSPLGKRVVAGEGPRPNRNYAAELARRGYVVLAPDYPSFGDYADYDFDGDAHESGTMKGIVNHIRCVDYLQSRADVDPDRIGVIGHSLGGHNAMFAGVFDERLKVIVSSCGWTPFHDYYRGDITGWTSDRYMPKLREEFGLEADRCPFDFYEVVAALAPRAFFSSSPLRDGNFEVVGVMKTIPRAARIYELLGVPDRLQVRYPNDGHDFPPRVRRQAYRFVDRVLGHRSPTDVPELEAGAEPEDGPEEGMASVRPFADDNDFSGPWELDRFTRPPRVRWGRRDGVLREVFYEGPPPSRGDRPTEIFAYYARPATGDGPFPAMLLVHGGGGRAFAEWARLWARRGYVALAMDTAGQGPDGKRHARAGPPQKDDVKFRSFDPSAIDSMWTYHAVAAVLLAHSLLAAQSEVDAARIGITGISWGGYLTCIVSGIDPRLKVSVPVYGCGFLHENSVWLQARLKTMDAASRELWIACFDPSRYLSGVGIPILFVNGTNDFAYPLDSYRKSYRLVPGGADLCVRVRMPHGHQAGWEPSEIGLFVDSILKGTPALPRWGPVEIEAARARATVSGDLALRDARLHYTTDDGPWPKRNWNSQDATLADGRVEAELPAQRPLVFYFSIRDEREALTSSEHRVLK